MAPRQLLPYLQTPPSPATLHWLSGGLLGSRFLRTVRLWDNLRHFYSPFQSSQHSWLDPFTYGDWRSRRFATTHNTQESATSYQILATCHHTPCLCQRSALSLLWGDAEAIQPWLEELRHLSHLSWEELNSLLQQMPFAVVPRALRNDLHSLVQQGFLSRPSRGRYHCLQVQLLPTPPVTPQQEVETIHPLVSLSQTQCWDIVHALESMAFLQPSLDPIIQQIWEHQAQQPQVKPRSFSTQRIFFEVTYILSDADRDRVDNYQFQLEQLWQSATAGVIQFESWLPHQQTSAQATVYPVCIHYTRRAKYLSAYGANADGTWGWHNYRLDRIQSQQLRILPWGDPAVPNELRTLWRSGSLPQPEFVQHCLEEAWGFNFYLPKSPMILRFPAKFAQDYVTHTYRHPTFQAIDYSQILNWLAKSLDSNLNLTIIQTLLQTKSPQDSYFRAWVRLGDINIVMRLREWRPAGEVLFPLELRQTMLQELEQEQSQYHNT